MKNIVALDIETKDPGIFSGHGYLWKEFKLLDCGASYFDKNGVLVSTSFEFLNNEKKGMRLLLEFLRDNKFDKLVFHNIYYDMPALQHFGLNPREFALGDTMCHSTLLEPFRPSNTLKSLCNEYNVPVKKISDEEMIEDIKACLGNEFLAADEKELFKYVEKTYNINLKKIKSYLMELKKSFPSVYNDYLTADTEATLLLYHILEEEVDKVCENFDTTFTRNGKTLRDVVDMEERGMVSDIVMSTTPIAIDWELIEKEEAEYEKNIAAVKKKKYSLFFHDNIKDYGGKDEDYSDDWRVEDILDILEENRDKLHLEYPNMFQKELDLIDYVAKLDNTEDMLNALQQSFLFQEINSVDEKNFKAIVDRYKGDIKVEDKFLKADGSLSLGEKAITNLMGKKDLPAELKLVFDITKEVKKISTNYTKFVKPFLQAREEKGGLYTQLFSYRTPQKKNFLVGSEDTDRGTATGRQSSNNINVQNIPRPTKDKFPIRSAFIARDSEFKKAGMVGEVKHISVDYDAQENRILNIMSGSKNGLAMYRDNPKADPHTSTAAMLLSFRYEKSPETLYQVRKATDDEEKAGITSSVTETFEPHVITVIVAKKERSAAKAVNFGIPYHQGIKALATALKMTYEEAKSLINSVSEVHPEYLEFYKKTIRAFKENGYVANMFGRIYKPYNMKPFLSQIDLEDFAEFFALGERFDMYQKNYIMRNKVVTVREALKDKLWKLNSKEFYDRLCKTPEYKIACPLKPYQWYLDVFEGAKEGIYDKGEFSEIVFLMLKQDLFYINKDKNIRDIIALHAKMVFKDGSFKNWDYVKECKVLRGQPLVDINGEPEKFQFKSSVVALRGDLENWRGEEDMFQVSKFIWSWAWHICNCTIEYIFNFIKKIVNAMCQGTGADMIKNAKVGLWEAGITDWQSENFLIDLHFLVHDAFEGSVLVENIEKAKEKFKKYMEISFDGVIMSVDIEIGDTWK